MNLSSVFDKKVGDFNKKGIRKPYKSRAKDSERLLLCAFKGNSVILNKNNYQKTRTKFVENRK